MACIQQPGNLDSLSLEERVDINHGRSECFCLFFHVEAELLHGWPIVDGEENRIAIFGVLVVMPLPSRHRENISFVPLQWLSFWNVCALAFSVVVKGRVIVLVR